MSGAIETICLASVNSYLVAAEDGFVLIDTGKPEKRRDLEARLSQAGCAAGKLRLIVLTHGDYDHAGNAAHLREDYGVSIAMHLEDAQRVQRGDWSLGMKPKPDKFHCLSAWSRSSSAPGPSRPSRPTSCWRTGVASRSSA
jgi:glyoxylase-like metal-dependent hydrolase (beta-lactamase superfamily II)